MTRFEVGKKYRFIGETYVYTCLGIMQELPIFTSQFEATPWVVPANMHFNITEYVEPKPPIIVERWINYYLRPDKTVSAQLFKSWHDAGADFLEREKSYKVNPLGCVKPLKTVYIKEQFDES